MGEITKDPELINAALEELLAMPMASSLVDIFIRYASEETVRCEDRGIINPSVVHRHRLTADIAGQMLGMVLEVSPVSDRVVRLAVYRCNEADENSTETEWFSVLAGEMGTGVWTPKASEYTNGIRVYLPAGKELILPSSEGGWFIDFLNYLSEKVAENEAVYVGDMPTYWQKNKPE